MKRLVVGAVALATLGCIGAAPAGAQTAPATTATFASPVSAPAGQPIWVRSITPCPVPASGVTSFVEAQVLQAIDLTPGDAVWGHVRDDGHWDVTLTAPGGPSGGATGRYLIEVQCGTTDQPPVDDPSAVSTITREYVSRTLEVTAGPAAGAQWIDGPVGGTATTTTTTTAPPPEPDPDAVDNQAASFAGVATTSTTSLKASTVGSKSTWVGSTTGADEIRSELVERSGGDDYQVAIAEDDPSVTLNASPASAGRAQAADGGIPPWAFLCAAMLAVGTVVAYGNRRAVPVEASAPATIDE